MRIVRPRRAANEAGGRPGDVREVMRRRRARRWAGRGAALSPVRAALRLGSFLLPPGPGATKASP